MARLPTPGADDGTWGDILNDFLDVAHAADGSLDSNVVDTAQIQNGAVTNAKLDTATQTQLAQGAAAYQKPAGGIPKTDLTSSVQTSLDTADSAVQSVNSKTGASITLTASDIGTVAAKQQATAPSSPATNDLWYDSTNDVWKRWSGSTWVNAGVNTYQPLNMEGLIASRPAASSVPAKSVYFATDDTGGTLYRSDGSAWLQLSPAVNAPSGQFLAGASLTSSLTNLNSTTAADLTGLQINFNLTSPRWVIAKIVLPLITCSAGSGFIIIFLETGANKEIQRTVIPVSSTGPTSVGAGSVELLFAASTGSTTLKARYVVSAGVTVTINATTTSGDGGGSYGPGIFAVTA
jgi:hypothetical protein